MTSDMSMTTVQAIPDTHEKRHSAAVATICDDSFVVIGGFGGEMLLSSCEVYNGNTNKWSRLPKDMPKHLYPCCAATIGRHIYVVAMRIESAGNEPSTVLAYSLDKKKWISKSPKKQRRTDIAVAVNGRLFVFGGYVFGRYAPEVYDPETDMWKDLPPMPHKHSYCAAAAAVDDKIYIIGDYSSVVDIFNVTTEQWSKGPNIPTSRYGHAAVSIGKFIIVIGGCDDNKNILSSTQIYNVDEKKWSDGPSMITARSYHTAATMKENRVVVAGGRNNNFQVLDTAEVITFNLSNTTSHVHRSINQNVNNESNSLVSRTKVLEKELGITVEGSVRTKIRNIERIMYGSIKEGGLVSRIEKVENDMIG